MHAPRTLREEAAWDALNEDAEDERAPWWHENVTIFHQGAHQGPSRDQCSRERADEDDDYKRGNHAHDADDEDDDDAVACENHSGLHTCSMVKIMKSTSTLSYINYSTSTKQYAEKDAQRQNM